MARRETLTRDAVLHAAMTLVDEEGLDALSMRRLATALNVQAMSLYNHVANKADLLDGIAEYAFAQVEPPAPELAWHEQVRAIAVNMYRVFARHPAVPAALATDRANPSSARALEPFDWLIGALYQGGLDDRRVRQALDAVMNLVWGSLLFSTAGFVDPAGSTGEADRSAYLRRLDPTKLPNFSRLLSASLTGIPTAQDDFEQTLDILLLGLISGADGS